MKERGAGEEESFVCRGEVAGEGSGGLVVNVVAEIMVFDCDGGHVLDHVAIAQRVAFEADGSFMMASLILDGRKSANRYTKHSDVVGGLKFLSTVLQQIK